MLNDSKRLSRPLQVVVVGHTNTGKTSLLRTLLRDVTFGEVDDAPGTTRDVRSLGVLLDQKEVLRWFDTPGLEDSVGLRDWIDELSVPGRRLDASDRIDMFLQDERAQERFEQESRVLVQVMQSDALLYVVDTRDQVLAKHRDELYLLQACAKPVLPVLNFTASPEANPGPWIQAFAKHGMHIHLAFDTVSPPINGEQMMYETLGQLLSEHKALFAQIANDVQQARVKRLKAATELLASLCLDVTVKKRVVINQPLAIKQAVQAFERQVRELESHCVARLLALYRFHQEDYLPPTAGWSQGAWQTDLFSGQALSDVGIELGKGAAIGAAAGATVDLLTAGLSLGTGTLVGALAGSAWQGMDRFGKGLIAKVRGRRELMASDAILIVLATRNLQLIAALEQRGHASRAPISIITKLGKTDIDQPVLLKLLSQAREQGPQTRFVTSWLSSNAPAVSQLSQFLFEAPLLHPFTANRLH